MAHAEVMLTPEFLGLMENLLGVGGFTAVEMGEKETLSKGRDWGLGVKKTDG